MEKFRRPVFLLLIVGLILGGCGGIEPEIIQVPMDFTPTNPVMPPRDIKDTPIYFASFEDQRRTGDQIGENVESANVVPAKAPPQEVISSLEKAFKREFNHAGFNVVENREKAERIIRVILQTLWVQEGTTFQARVVARVEVSNKSGDVLANQGFRGSAGRWGISYSPEQYRKVISDAYVELLKSIFQDDAFMKKLF
jgi:uncharacterized lipoprotein YajG